MTYEVVYIGGPRHGERKARQGEAIHAPEQIIVLGQEQNYRYCIRPLADTPGALAYIYDPEAKPAWDS